MCREWPASFAQDEEQVDASWWGPLGLSAPRDGHLPCLLCPQRSGEPLLSLGPTESWEGLAHTPPQTRSRCSGQGQASAPPSPWDLALCGSPCPRQSSPPWAPELSAQASLGASGWPRSPLTGPPAVPCLLRAWLRAPTSTMGWDPRHPELSRAVFNPLPGSGLSSLPRAHSTSCLAGLGLAPLMEPGGEGGATAMASSTGPTIHFFPDQGELGKQGMAIPDHRPPFGRGALAPDPAYRLGTPFCGLVGSRPVSGQKHGVRGPCLAPP